MNPVASSRNKNYLRQIKSSLLFNVLVVLISFITIPIMVKYLGNEKYGVWSTLLSICSWILMFDVGLGNGLRNKLAEFIPKQEFKIVRKYISTTYFATFCIALFFISVFYFITNWIDWTTVFNTNEISKKNLDSAINFIFVFIFVNFVLSIIDQVLNAVHKTDLIIFKQF